MPLIPETGTGVANANSFVSRSFFDSYFEDRGLLEPIEDAFSDEQIEGAILYATRDIDQSYHWTGVRQTTAQALGWPRVGARNKEDKVITSGTVPLVLQEATCERARDHLLVRALNQATDPEEELTRLKVGPIELSWDRVSGALPENSYFSVLLSGLFTGSASIHEVVRA